jgi:hypothetical protein
MPIKHVPTWTKIEICPGCDGKGETWEYGHANSVHTYNCNQCNNTGRIEVTTTRVEEPTNARMCRLVARHNLGRVCVRGVLRVPRAGPRRDRQIGAAHGQPSRILRWL